MIETSPTLATITPGTRQQRRAERARRLAGQSRQQNSANLPETTNVAPALTADTVLLHAVTAEDIQNCSDTTLSLIQSRAHLAEVATQARTGKLFGKTILQTEALEAATDEYQEARTHFINEQLDLIPATASNDEKRQFVATLHAREDGALMGEEANYYLDKIDQPSIMQTSVERYNCYSKKKQLAIGIGVTALAATGFGFVLGGAAAGGVIAARFGRSYFTEEAKRRGKAKTDIEKQQLSTLRSTSADDYTSYVTGLESTAGDIAELKDYDLTHADQTLSAANERIAEDRSKEKTAKRKALAWAVGSVAVGTTIGAVVQHYTDYRSLMQKVDIETNVSTDAPATKASAIQQFSADTAPSEPGPKSISSYPNSGSSLEIATEIEESERITTAAQEVPATAAEKYISARSQRMFGEFAGKSVSIKIPAGSNIWDQLEASVDRQMPNTAFAEKQRIVGNMVHQLEHEYPNRDLSMVRPLETFTVKQPR